MKARGLMEGAALAAVLLATSAPVNAAPVASPAVIRAESVASSSRPGRGQERGREHTRGDPAERVNRSLFSVHTFFDRILFRPAAMAYKAVVPKFIRTGIRHVLSNIGEPVVFVNDVLQLKPKRAARTFARFAINSTVGIGGVVDVAKRAELPHHDNGFGDTLGRYGVGPGPYLFIPFVGPTDLRDLIGGGADGVMLPLAIGYPFDTKAFAIPTTVLGGLDERAEADADLKALLSGAADPYATLRSVFLQSRAAQIAEIRHDAPATPFSDPLLDPEGTPAPDATSAAPAAPDAFDNTPEDPEAASPIPVPPVPVPSVPAPSAPATSAPEVGTPGPAAAATPAPVPATAG